VELAKAIGGVGYKPIEKIKLKFIETIPE